MGRHDVSTRSALGRAVLHAIVIATAFGVVSVHDTRAMPSPCAGKRLEEECRQAHWVFVGKMVEGEPHREHLWPVTLEVIKPFKGQLPGRVTVNWDFGDAQYGGGTAFRLDETYLVMTYPPKGDQPPAIITCGGTLPLDDAVKQGFLKKVKRGCAPTPKLQGLLDGRLWASYQPSQEVFGTCEFKLDMPKDKEALRRIPDSQIHDAYDADRDGGYVRVSARLRSKDQEVTVSGFAMREAPDGPWQWRVRWSPPREGAWSAHLAFEAGTGKNSRPIRIERELLDPINAHAERPVRREGLLVRPGKGDNPRYLRMMKADGTSEAVWLFGACRAWVVRSQDPDNDWSPDEWLDREKELLAPMREGGFNLLNQWMAPWEFLLVHHDRAEFWRKEDDAWERHPLPEDAAWTPYQCYDQGRAGAFDELVKMCEGDRDRPTIRLLLSPLPHQCLQLKEHPWGAQESGWSPENDAGKQKPERLNGFSAFRSAGGPKCGPEGMSAWDFFEADPSRPLDDWRSQLFDHQANFFRYLIARWGYSRAVGVWVIVDELDAVGDVVGVMSEKRGWWAHPQCDRWLANVLRLFRGQLKRSDGLLYRGDPFGHPLHAATTSFGGQAEKGSNIEWDGGPADARPDLFGWHWYPSLGWRTSWNDVWTFAMDGVARYAQTPIGQAPRLISEFGAPDRSEPTDKPSELYPTLYHHAIWAAVFSGQAGTPMDWDDGKQFGELRWRERPGIFDRAHYPINHVEQLQALRRFLGDLRPDTLTPCSAPGARVKCSGAGELRLHALYAAAGQDALYGWLFSPDGKAEFSVEGLKPGRYRLTWYDPWTGNPAAGQEPQEVEAVGGQLHADAAPALALGQDVAFKLLPAGK